MNPQLWKPFSYLAIVLCGVAGMIAAPPGEEWRGVAVCVVAGAVNFLGFCEGMARHEQITREAAERTRRQFAESVGGARE